MKTRTRLAATAVAVTAVGVGTALPAAAITTPSCDDPQASEYVRLLGNDTSGNYPAVACFANDGTWTGDIGDIIGVTTGNNAVTITYVDGAGTHSTDLPQGVDTQLAAGAVSVTGVTIH
ncbi:hypothetical protein KIH74_30685 [Kineosporia sp. J2-2]|uniref:Uncharacterized protein n=1 Tax=Kineosporia corallincola TaxID=2835133 RepID=A0ABS5TRD2_9ACTN|nr:hypothetical protein [Kineosporia corallincola]MBT0773352.1 hypothetical protein [Kineosporia corallincola]